MNRAIAGCLFVLWVAASPAMATVVVDVGDWDLLPDTPGQQITITVTGTELVDGVQFNLQVADGGTHPDVGGSIVGPTISDVDLLNGTIFEEHNEGVVIGDTYPQLWSRWTSVSQSYPVEAQGLLATVWIDTTDFFGPNSWDLWMAPTVAGPSNLFGPGSPEVVIMNGSINIAGDEVIPEPSTVVVWSLLGVAGAFILARRRKHAR